MSRSQSRCRVGFRGSVLRLSAGLRSAGLAQVVGSCRVSGGQIPAMALGCVDLSVLWHTASWRPIETPTDRHKGCRDAGLLSGRESRKGALRQAQRLPRTRYRGERVGGKGRSRFDRLTTSGERPTMRRPNAPPGGVQCGIPWPVPWACASSGRTRALCATALRNALMPRRGDRLVITLECMDCGSRGYVSSKNRRNDPDRMDLRKFCARCREHRRHRETR